MVAGAHSDRRELFKTLKHLATGDVVTVTRIDRLARSYQVSESTISRLQECATG